MVPQGYWLNNRYIIPPLPEPTPPSSGGGTDQPAPLTPTAAPVYAPTLQPQNLFGSDAGQATQVGEGSGQMVRQEPISFGAIGSAIGSGLGLLLGGPAGGAVGGLLGNAAGTAADYQRANDYLDAIGAPQIGGLFGSMSALGANTSAGGLMGAIGRGPSSVRDQMFASIGPAEDIAVSIGQPLSMRNPYTATYAPARDYGSLPGGTPSSTEEVVAHQRQVAANQYRGAAGTDPNERQNGPSSGGGGGLLGWLGDLLGFGGDGGQRSGGLTEKERQGVDDITDPNNGWA